MPAPKASGMIGGARISETVKDPKGSGGEPLLLPPVHPTTQQGEWGLEDQKPVMHLDLAASGPPGLGATYRPDMLAPSQVVEERRERKRNHRRDTN